MRALRVLLAFLALVLALGAADPTPRFLGLPRLGDSDAVPSPHGQARAVARDFDLPTAVSVRGSTRPQRPQPASAPLLPPSASRGARPVLDLVATDFERTCSLAGSRQASFTPPLRL